MIMTVMLALFSTLFSGCSSAPSSRTTQYTTLRVIGASRDAAMKIAANAYVQKQITDEQWAKIRDIHDNKLQPTYALAVATARADLSSLASPDLTAITNQLAQLVAQFAGLPPPTPLTL